MSKATLVSALFIVDQVGTSLTQKRCKYLHLVVNISRRSDIFMRKKTSLQIDLEQLSIDESLLVEILLKTISPKAWSQTQSYVYLA